MKSKVKLDLKLINSSMQVEAQVEVEVRVEVAVEVLICFGKMKIELKLNPIQVKLPLPKLQNQSVMHSISNSSDKLSFNVFLISNFLELNLKG